jgi:hypothetical protein
LTTAAQTSQAVPGRVTRLLDALEQGNGCAAALLVGPHHAAHLAGYSLLSMDLG